MKWGAAKEASLIMSLALILGAGGSALARENDQEPQFKYVGGTEDVLEGCDGRVQLTAESLTFQCAQYTVAIPYSSISFMQYRPDVSKSIR